jgi:rhamnose transport system permease protein
VSDAGPGFSKTLGQIPPWPADEAAPSSPSGLGKVAEAIRGTREFGTIVALTLVVVVFSLTTNNFWSHDSLWSVLSSSAISIAVAAGMTAVIVSRQIDLSIGATLGVAAYLTGVLLNAGFHPLIALVAAVLVGFALGAINGVIVAWLQVPAIIATLGTATIYRGLLFIVAPRFLGFLINADQIPRGFRLLTRQSIAGLPMTFVIASVAAIAIGLVLGYTPWGRNLYALGSNPDAARFVGIPVERSVFSALALVGATAGLAGFLYVMRYASVGVRAGVGFDFEVISGVVIGGVAIFGGAGRVFGATLGVVILNTLGRGFVLTSIPEFWKVVATGAAIVVAVGVDAAIVRRRSEIIRLSRRLHAVAKPEEAARWPKL